MLLARILPLCLLLPAAAETITVATDQELRLALPTLKAGDTLLLKAGSYRPGLSVANLTGRPDAPIVISGLDPDNPPHFSGGNQALQLSSCSHLIIQHLRISGQIHNGLNIDDGGKLDHPAHHISIKDIHVSDIGPSGNFDGIKLSGLEDFTVSNCTVAGWGGQAIDMVGCHRGIISGCTIRGKDGYSQHTGPQTKGGCREIIIRNNRFEHAGQRPVQAGGSTGKAYFRPPGAKYEAKEIHIHDNVIIGGTCATAFTSLDGGSFHHNTILNPDKWIFRILQETKGDGFPSCRNVEIHHNVIQFERAKVRGALNIGPDTAANTFRFHHNIWFSSDQPEKSMPTLPSPEADSHYGLDPLLAPQTKLPTAELAAGFGPTR